MSLRNKVVAITGAGSGIGLATARKLAECGASLSICDRSTDALNAATTTLRQFQNIDLLATVVDVTEGQQVTSWIDETVKRFGGLHGAVNAAGILIYKRIADLDKKEWKDVIDVNLTGTFLCVQAELDHMDDGGSVVNLASRSGIRGSPNAGSYCASKFGVLGLTECAAKEVGHRNIRVNAVCPYVNWTSP